MNCDSVDAIPPQHLAYPRLEQGADVAAKQRPGVFAEVCARSLLRAAFLRGQ